MTFPKLPLPTTFRSSKSSINNDFCRFSTKATPTLMLPVPYWTSDHSAPACPSCLSCSVPFFSFLFALASSAPGFTSSNFGFTFTLPMNMSWDLPAFGGALGLRMYNETDKSCVRETSNLYCVLSPAHSGFSGVPETALMNTCCLSKSRSAYGRYFEEYRPCMVGAALIEPVAD